MPFDLLLIGVAVYRNQWAAVAWFSTALPVNLIFEILFMIFDHWDVPDLLVLEPLDRNLEELQDTLE